MDVLSSHYIVLQNAPESSWIKPIGSSDTIRYSGNDRFSKRPEVMPPSLDRFEFIDRAIRSFFFFAILFRLVLEHTFFPSLSYLFQISGRCQKIVAMLEEPEGTSTAMYSETQM